MFVPKPDSGLIIALGNEIFQALKNHTQNVIWVHCDIWNITQCLSLLYHWVFAFYMKKIVSHWDCSLTLPSGWQSIHVSQKENGPPSGSLLLGFQTWSKKKQEQFHINHEHKSWLPVHNIPPQKASKTVDLSLWSWSLWRLSDSITGVT